MNIREISVFNKFLRRLFYWNIESYICFRKRPEPTVRYTLGDELKAKGFKIREVDRKSTKDISSLSYLYKEAFSQYTTSEQAKTEILEAFESGEKCFILENGKRFYGMGWLGGEDSPMLASVGKFIKNKQNIAVNYRAYVSPFARGFGAQKAINNARESEAHKTGKECLYCFVGVKNTASINNCIKFFSESKLIYHVSVELPKLKFNFFPKLNDESWQIINI